MRLPSPRALTQFAAAVRLGVRRTALLIRRAASRNGITEVAIEIGWLLRLLGRSVHASTNSRVRNADPALSIHIYVLNRELRGS